MTTHQFKVWLVTNGYTQLSLASELGLSSQTITNYCASGRFPKPFVFALNYLAAINNK